MARLKQELRRLIAAALQATGILWLLATVRLRRRIAVLTYHRVLPAGADTFSAPGIIVTPGTFDRHMAYLRRRFNVLSARQFVDILDGHLALPRRACLITFDDGWYDNHTHALPVLRAHQLPILLFVASRFPGTIDCFWQERTARALAGLANDGEAGRISLETLGFRRLANTNPAERFQVICDEIAELKRLEASAREDRMADINAAARGAGMEPGGPGDDRFLGWSELREMTASGLVTIGSHAASHRPLPSLTAVQTEAELSESIATIRRELGITPMTLAYPNGDVNTMAATAAREAGFAAAFTTRRALATVDGDRYLLPRLNIHEGSAGTEAELLCKIAGIF